MEFLTYGILSSIHHDKEKKYINQGRVRSRTEFGWTLAFKN